MILVATRMQIKTNSATIADHDGKVVLSFTQVIGTTRTSMKRRFLSNLRLIVNSMNASIVVEKGAVNKVGFVR
jgi:hypothetical protein